MYRYDEPFFAHVTTGSFSNLYYSWVTVEVANQYGKVTKTIEFEPEYEDNDEVLDNNTSLPSSVTLYFEYLDEELSVDSKMVKIRIFFTNTENVSYIVLERLKEGLRIPSRIEIDDIAKGYFDTTIDRNTTFTAVSYNKNGSTRGEPLFVPYKSASGVDEVVCQSENVKFVQIFQINGTSLYNGNPDDFDERTLPTGVYIKRLFYEDGRYEVVKIIK